MQNFAVVLLRSLVHGDHLDLNVFLAPVLQMKRLSLVFVLP
jgi:hypothetical protein